MDFGIILQQQSEHMLGHCVRGIGRSIRDNNAVLPAIVDINIVKPSGTLANVAELLGALQQVCGDVQLVDNEGVGVLELALDGIQVRVVHNHYIAKLLKGAGVHVAAGQGVTFGHYDFHGFFLSFSNHRVKLS